MTSNKINETSTPIVILVNGPFSSGKTQSIQTISEIEVVSAEVNGIEAGMDFGRIEITQTKFIYFFGAPGARRFEVDWIRQLGKFFNTSHFGVLVLFNPSYPETFREAKGVIEYVRESAAPYLVAANVRENAKMPLAKQYEFIEAMPKYFSEPTIKICNATQKASVKEVVVELLKLMPPAPLIDQAITKVHSL